MGKIAIKAPKTIAQAAHEHATPQQLELSEEDRSKDAFFVQIAEIGEAMIARHDKDFAIGTLVLLAKFIAEGKPLINRTNGGGETVSTVKPV
jgi:predicted nuclease of predicted toxin-antitoxin system